MKLKNNLTGFKGVRDTGNGNFAARIMVNRREICLGRYATAKEASAVYDSAAKKYFGDFARSK